jgi:AAA ATPase domain
MSTIHPVLEINNFLGIKQARVIIKPVTLMIGPQASGKSVIAKLLYYFTEFTSHLFSCVQGTGGKRELNKLCSDTFISYFSPSSWSDDNFHFRFCVGNDYIDVRRGPSKKTPSVRVDYSPWFPKEMRRIHRYILSAKNKIQEHEDVDPWDIEWKGRTLFREHVSHRYQSSWPLSQVFVPAGRSFFANLQNNVFGFLSSSNAIDPFLSIFGRYFDATKRRELRHYKKDPVLMKRLDAKIQSIICGEYLHEKGRDFVKIKDGRKINLSSASSGQQEAVPLAQTLRGFFRGRAPASSVALYIEEPEAHLFPVSQKHMVELLGAISNHNESLKLFVTTHSPYVLSSFNNLLLAGKIKRARKNHKLEEAESSFPFDSFLDPADVAAYSIGEGSIRSILSDSGLIDAEIIDSVSSDIADEFEKLSELYDNLQ